MHKDKLPKTEAVYKRRKESPMSCERSGASTP